MNEQTIFTSAIEHDASQRSAFLDDVCGADHELRRRVEQLLDLHDRAGGFLQHPAAGIGAAVVPPLPERPGTRIGPYKLLQQIGEGGMGLVYMAEQTEPIHRKVAIKLVKNGLENKQAAARFEAERQALALMEHQNIAKVLDAGTTESGQPYFVMELVHGLPITKYCDQHRLSPRQRLELFIPVCQAVQHAHQKGIIHRDLKPSNVLIALYDGKPVPKVIDFGVAKALGQKLTDKTMFTQFGAIVGTLEYMSPEQAEKSHLDVDTRSDIYSLGVMLYELLTGTTPLDRQRMKSVAILELLRIIKEEEPQKPSTRLSTVDTLASIAANRSLEPKKLSGIVRGELDWIVMKAMEKDRNRRYETANGFAADVQRYLADEPVIACPPSAAYKFRKFARRNKGLLTTLTVIAATLLIGAFASTWQAIRASHAEILAEDRLKAETAARKEADQERQNAVAARGVEVLARQEAVEARNLAREKEQDALSALAQREQAMREKEAALSEAKQQELLARRRFYAAQMNLAQQAFATDDRVRLLELLEGQRPRFDEPDLRSFEWYYLWQELHQQLKTTIRGPRGLGRNAVYSPDGKVVAASSDGGLMTVWDVQTGQEVNRLQGDTGSWNQLTFSPDGRMLAHSNGPHNNAVRLWDLETNTTTLINGTGEVRSLAFSPDGKLLATGAEKSQRKGVILWDVATLTEAAYLELPHGVLHVTFAADGKQIVVCHGWEHNGGMTQVWDLSGSVPREDRSFPWAITAKFAPDGRSLFTANMSVNVIQWELTGTARRSFPQSHYFNVPYLAISADGRYLAQSDHPKAVRVRDLIDDSVQTFHCQANIDTVAFSPDGGTLLTGCGREGTLKVWNLAQQTESASLENVAGMRWFTVSLQGTLVAGIDSAQGAVRLWDAATNREHAFLSEQAASYGSVAFSPDGKLLATATSNWGDNRPGIVTVWDTASSNRVAELKGHTRGVYRVAFSPDGKTLASSGFDGMLHLWEVSGWQKKASALAVPPEWAPLPVLQLSFSTDGKTIAAGGMWGVLFLFDAESLQRRVIVQERFQGRLMSTDSLVFSPDGLHFATGGSDGVIRLRETMTGMLVASFAGAGTSVNSLAFFPDGRTLAASGGYNRVALWDVSTGQERYALQLGHAADVAVSPDGLTLIAGGKLFRATRTPEATALRNENSMDDPVSLANLNTIAYSHWNAGRLPEAAQSFRSAITRSRLLVAESSGNPDHRRELASAAFSLSGVLHEMGELEQAVQTEQEILKELAGDHPESDEARQEIASHLNSLAWRLVTRLNRKDASIPHAITLARRAVAADPINAAFHTTLGVALFRAENWKAAQEALMQSMRLSQGGDAMDWFFMAMASHRQGEVETAADWYRVACVYADRYGSDDGQLYQLRTEARNVMQRPDLDTPDATADEVRLRTLITAHPEFASLASLLQDMQNELKR